MLALLLPAGFSVAAGPVAAQQPSQAQVSAIRQNCRADYQTYCASVPTGGSASLACLRQNSANLSPACQQAVNAVGGAQAPAAQNSAGAGAGMGRAPAGRPPMREDMAELRQQCGRDYVTFCRGVGFGGGRALGCLSDNRESLSHECREALMSLRQGR
jgi:hypothetical protein